MALDINMLEKIVLQHADESISSGNLLGEQARVYENGTLVFEMRRGEARKDRSLSLGADNVYRMASMTKPITSAATLIAEEEGLLSIYDSVSKYIPEYKDVFVAERDENGKLVKGDRVDLKIYQCLNHTCGIFGGFPSEVDGKQYPSPGDEQLPFLTEDMRRTVTEAVLNYPKFLVGYVPGTCTGYCSYAGCDICAEIISRVTSMPFEEYFKKRIFDPLGMKDTTFTPNENQWARLVDLTTKVNGECVPLNMGEHIFGNFYRTYHAAGAGIVSTLDDYSHFALMLLGKGVYNGVRILTEESIYKMKTPYVMKGTTGVSPYESWGLGVRVTREHPRLPDGCYGWSGAYGTHFWIDDKNNICALFFKNSPYDGGSEASTSRQFEADVMSALK